MMIADNNICFTKSRAINDGFLQEPGLEHIPPKLGFQILIRKIRRAFRAIVLVVGFPFNTCTGSEMGDPYSLSKYATSYGPVSQWALKPTRCRVLQLATSMNHDATYGNWL